MVNVECDLLVSCGNVVPDLDWVEQDHVEVTACGEHLIDVYDHVVELGHCLESSKEALVGCLSCYWIRSILKGNNTTVKGRNDIKPIEILSINSLHFSGTHQVIALVYEPLDAPIFRVSKMLVLPAATALFDDGCVIEFSGYWVNKTDEAVAIRALHLSSNVTDVITRCTGHVSC